LMGCVAQITRKGLFPRVAAFFENRTLARCHEVTGESRFSTGFLREHFPHLRVHHVDLAPDFVFSQVQRQPQTRPARLIFVGRLSFQKGGDVVLRALSKLDAEFQLVVVGAKDEPLAAELRPELSNKLWERLEFKQNLTSELLAAEFTRATMMVCATRVDTGPMAVKEAAVAGLPVIGSNVGGLPDYIVADKNGLLFPSGDADACADALRRALQHPLFREGAVDKATLASVRQQLSPRKMADSFLRLYRELTQEPPGSN
jgi:glycosyltransferase involved in cell wall biosynthesis